MPEFNQRDSFSHDSDADPEVLGYNYNLLALKIIEGLCVEQPFSELLHQALAQLESFYGASHAVVLTTKAREQEILYVMGDSQDASAVWLPVPMARYPEVIQAADRMSVMVLEPDDDAEGWLQDVLEERESRAVAVFPLIWDGEAFGALELSFSSYRRIRPPARDSLQLVAAVIAQRFRSSDLYRAMKEQTNLTAVTIPAEEPGLPVLQKYREFFQRASDGVVVLGLDNTVMHINPTGEAITGYSRRGLVGAQLSTIIEPADREALTSRLAQAVEFGAAQTFELNLVTTSQDTILVQVSTSAVLSDEEVLVLSFKDITEERRLGEELRSTKEFLEQLIDSTVDGILVAGHHDGVILFNKGAARIFGADAREVLGRKLVTDLFPEGEVDKIKALLDSADHGGSGRLEPVQTEVLNADQQRLSVSLSASRLHDGDDEPGVVMLISDLTERLAMEERLAQAQERLVQTEQQAMIADLVGATAHELNQPLTSVMGYAELLRRRMDSDDENRPAVDTIIREAERLANIVRKIDQIIAFETRAFNSPGVHVLDLDKSE